jgi:hypothetical protein
MNTTAAPAGLTPAEAETLATIIAGAGRHVSHALDFTGKPVWAARELFEPDGLLAEMYGMFYELVSAADDPSTRLVSL